MQVLTEKFFNLDRDAGLDAIATIASELEMNSVVHFHFDNFNLEDHVGAVDALMDSVFVSSLFIDEDENTITFSVWSEECL